jgi:hypothetical protein
MAVPKVHIDNSRLLARMKKYEKVTGKAIGSTLRRNARLMAVNLATSTPPYGKSPSSKKLGEMATQNDILRVYRPGTDTKFAHSSSVPSFEATIKKTVTENISLREAILGALAAKDTGKLNAIFRNVKGFSKIHAKDAVHPSFHHRSRNNYGRVRKNWKANEVVLNTSDLKSYVKARQLRVGMTKASWAAAAIKVNADVKDALSGIPAWVKRHINNVPSAVIDNAESIAPHIKLTNKLPWASFAMRKNDMDEAIRISRQKFYKSMGTEIRAVLKKAGSNPF